MSYPQPPPEQHATASRIIEGLFDMTVASGIDAAALRAAMGLDARGLEPFGPWIPHPVTTRFWRGIERLSGDPMLGITLAERVPLGTFGVAFHALNASGTLREACELILRHQNIVATGLRLSLTEGGSVGRLHLGVAPGLGPLPDVCIENLAAVLLRGARGLTGVPLRPVEVAFMHAPRVREEGEYERRLDAPVRFGAARDEIVVHDADLGLAIPTADPTVLALLDAAASTVVPSALSVAERVQRALPPLLERGEPRVEVVARMLKCSKRSLQRWLSREGTTFAALVDAVRRELSLRYVAQPNLGLSEVASLAGFADASAFFRAFRRWTGQTPAEHRRELWARRGGCSPPVTGSRYPGAP